MNDRWRLWLRYTLRGSAYAFAFPVGITLLMTRGEVGVGPALLAGLFSAVTAGPLMTTLFTYFVPYTRRIPFLPAILLQGVVFFGAGGALIFLNTLALVAVLNHTSPFDPHVLGTARSIAGGHEMKIAYGVGIGFFIATAMFNQLGRKLGPGVLVSWLTGKYHRPREEAWVFMFLDLKDSTPLAERLGSVQFSRLLQEFFGDLGIAVWATRGTVSHYIGDEAVIAWRPEKAFKDANCLRIVDKPKKEIESRPQFKAGVHCGPVVVAEVGRAKSEILYLGDAVNTTARIVGMCSPLSRDLIVSKDVAERLRGSSYTLEPLGAHALKGKSEPLELFAVYK